MNYSCMNITPLAVMIIAFLSACRTNAQDRHLFFLHGMYLELNAPEVPHPEYGRNEYYEMLDAFKKQGFIVHSEIRPRNTDGVAYAKNIAAQADSLVKAGVPASHITVVGTSKGGYIAEYVSDIMKNKAMNFVFVGCCDDDIKDNPDVHYYGNILSVYEQSDKWHSCQQMKNRYKEGVTRFKEISLNTGLGHGFLYKVFDGWLLPASQWGKGQYDKANYKAPKIDSAAFNGIVLLHKNGATAYAQCKGFANLSTKTPLKYTDRFGVGSVSKQFTAIIVLREVDKGTLDLHTPIKKYLPELKRSWADTVTIHHLLTHRHGITHIDSPTAFPVGSAFSYSGLGYQLAGKIVGRHSGMSYEAQADSLFKLCGMHHTRYPTEKDTVMVTSYLSDSATELKSSSLLQLQQGLATIAAAGGFISTAEDLALFNKALHTGKLLKPATYQLMLTPHTKRDHPIFGTIDYGYAHFIIKRKGISLVGHTGMIPGSNTLNFYAPDHKASFVILSNTQYYQADTKRSFAAHAHILDALIDQLIF